MDRLPDLPLLLIFGFVDNHQERAMLELVCRRWRNILLKDGWKHVRRIAKLRDALWIGPIGDRCGGHLTELSLVTVPINSALIRLFVAHCPALKHLHFHACKLEQLDPDALDLFRQFAIRLCSLTLTFCKASQYQLHLHRFLPHSSRLRHLGLHTHQCQPIPPLRKSPRHRLQRNIDSSAYNFSADLRSLYLNSHTEYRADMVEMLERVQRDCPMLEALYLDNCRAGEQLLRRISHLRNLVFLRIALDYEVGGRELGSCLMHLPHLVALQLDLQIETERLSGLFRHSIFHGLVHLGLYLDVDYPANHESIGLLSSVVPRLRSLNLHIHSSAEYSLEQTRAIGCEVLKIAQNGILEYMNVPCASFAIGEFVQLVRLCPDLRSFGANVWPNEQLPKLVDELRHVVADHWYAGKRKNLPLRVWIHGKVDMLCWSWHDSFLAIRTVQFGFAPPNPVLNTLFRDKVFSDDGGGGTPSFVTEYYSSRP